MGFRNWIRERQTKKEQEAARQERERQRKHQQAMEKARMDLENYQSRLQKKKADLVRVAQKALEIDDQIGCNAAKNGWKLAARAEQKVSEFLVSLDVTKHYQDLSRISNSFIASIGDVLSYMQSVGTTMANEFSGVDLSGGMDKFEVDHEKLHETLSKINVTYEDKMKSSAKTDESLENEFEKELRTIDKEDGEEELAAFDDEDTEEYIEKKIRELEEN